MGQVIHARERDGKTMLRLFSENSNTYVTGEITEEELRAQLLFDALWEALDEFDRGIGQRIKRAIETGTSSMVYEESKKPTDPWKEEAEENRSFRAPDWWVKEQKEKSSRFKALLQQALEAWGDD